MAGTVKKLQFSEGTDVGAPSDLSLATSTSVISTFVDDAAYVASEGAAAEGSVYLNSTDRVFRMYVGGAWRNAVPQSDPTDATKKFLVDVAGNGTGVTATLDFNATANRTYTYPDASTTLVGTDTTQTLTNKTLTSPTVSSPAVTGGTFAGVSTLSLDDIDSAFNLTIQTQSTLTAGRALTFDVDDGDRQIRLAGNLTTIGSNNIAFTSTGGTSVTLPTTGTLSTLAGSETLTNKTLTSPVITTGLIAGGSLDVQAAGNLTIGGSVGANNLTIGSANSTVFIAGDFTVLGDTTVINTSTLQVEDPNILINRGGNDASSEGAGLTVTRTGTSGSLIFDSSMASKWKLGLAGAEVQIADISTAQTLTNKTISSSPQVDVDNLRLDGNTLSSTNSNGNVIVDPNGTGIISLVGNTEVTGYLKTDTALRVEDPGAGTNYVAVQAPSALAGTYTLTLPVDDGTSGQVLSTDGSGVLSWASAVTNPMDSAGDLIIGGALGAANKLDHPGSAGWVLASTGTSTTAWTQSPAVTSIGIGDGSVSAPSLFLSSDSDGSGTGLYRVAANSLGFSANGVSVGSYSSGGTWTFGVAGNGNTHGFSGLVQSGTAGTTGNSTHLEFYENGLGGTKNFELFMDRTNNRVNFDTGSTAHAYRFFSAGTQILDGTTAGVWTVGPTSGSFAGNKIRGVNDGTAHAAGDMGETSSAVPGGAVTPAASGSYKTVASITVAAGQWKLTAATVLAAGTSTGLNFLETGISTVTDSATFIDSLCRQGYDPTNVGSGAYNAGSGTIVSPTTSTTYFLVCRINYSTLGTATYTTASKILAERNG